MKRRNSHTYRILCFGMSLIFWSSSVQAAEIRSANLAARNQAGTAEGIARISQFKTLLMLALSYAGTNFINTQAFSQSSDSPSLLIGGDKDRQGVLYSDPDGVYFKGLYQNIYDLGTTSPAYINNGYVAESKKIELGYNIFKNRTRTVLKKQLDALSPEASIAFRDSLNELLIKRNPTRTLRLSGVAGQLETTLNHEINSLFYSLYEEAFRFGFYGDTYTATELGLKASYIIEKNIGDRADLPLKYGLLAGYSHWKSGGQVARALEYGFTAGLTFGAYSPVGPIMKIGFYYGRRNYQFPGSFEEQSQHGPETISLQKEKILGFYYELFFDSGILSGNGIGFQSLETDYKHSGAVYSGYNMIVPDEFALHPGLRMYYRADIGRFSIYPYYQNHPSGDIASSVGIFIRADLGSKKNNLKNLQDRLNREYENVILPKQPTPSASTSLPFFKSS